MKRRIIALLLAIVMLVGNIPFQAFATEIEPQETTTCGTEGCTYAAGHEGECSNYVAPTEPCGTEGCTYGADHEGQCSNYVAPTEPCGTEGCAYGLNHEGNCSNYVAPVVEPAADAVVYVTVSNRGELGMAYEEVTVSDTNQDGKLSVDEAMYAAHLVYGKGYTSQEGMITQLWGVETTNVSVFRNHTVISTDVGAETIGAGDYLVASVDQDAVNDYDKYSRFNALEKTANAGESFTLTLTDDAGNALAGMEIGLWSGNGSTTMTGLTTDVNGSVTLTLDQEGLYCVTAKGTVVESSIDVNTMKMRSIEIPIIAPVCVVSVYGTVDRSASGWSSTPDSEGQEPATFSARSGAPVSVTADGNSVEVTSLGNFKDKQYGDRQIPVYHAKVSEDATITISSNDGVAYVPYNPNNSYLGYSYDLEGQTKTSLESWLTDATGYGLDTTNSVVYMELTTDDYSYISTYGVLIELEPASGGTTTTYTVTLPTNGEGYTVAASGDSASPVTAGGSYSFTVTVSGDYDDTNMVVMANTTTLSAKDGVYTITGIQEDQTITVTGVEKKAVSFISVTADGTECELTTHGTYVSSAANMTNEITVYKVSANEGAAIVINKLADDGGDALGSARCAFSYGGTAGRAAYPVSVDSSYAVGDDAKTKFGLATTNTVYYIEIGGQTRIPLYGLLVEVIPAPATTYEVTLPTGDGYKVEASGNSASPVEEGGSYSFTVTVSDDYDDTNMVVKANSTTLSAVDGVYTITGIQENQTITVTGVEKKAVALISVTVGGEAAELTTYGTYQSSVSGNKTQIPVYMVSADEGAAVAIQKGANGDGGSGSYRRAWKYGASSSNYSEPTYAISVGSGYAVNDAAKEKFDLTTTNTVYYIEVGTYSEGTPLYGLLVEVIPAPATTYEVTLPTGEGYTAAASGSSASPVAAGGSYSFTVTVSDDYDGTAMVVMANGTELTADNGVYTIENITAPQNITVSGVEKKGVSYISVTADGTECELTALGTYVSSAAAKTNEIPVYMVSANEGTAIVINKLADDGGDAATVNDTNARCLFAYGGTANRGSYPISVDSSYAAGDEAKAKFGLNTTNTVYYVEVGGLTNRTPLYGLLVEVIPAPVTTYIVSLPTNGEGYTVAASGDSASPVAAGGSYSFTVTVSDNYDDTNMVVKANDTVLTADNGVYTIENISAAQNVTVSGVEKKVTAPVSVTADGTAVSVTTQGSFGNKMYYGNSQIPVYYAKASEAATLNITYNESYSALDTAYLFSVDPSKLMGVKKADLEGYFTTASDYGLDTQNSVAYIEFANGFDPAFGLLIELEPASGGTTATYIVSVPSGDGYTVTASGSSASPVEEGGSYSFTVTVSDDYDGTNMVVMANGTELTADNGVYTIENITAPQNITVTGVEPITVSPGESSEKLTGITGEASSTDATEDADVSNAFDGDYNTYWATAADGSLDDAYLIADLGGTYTINKVEYTKRYDSTAGYNCTGNLLNYVIEVSTDGEIWTQVAKGETNDGTTAIEFEPVQAAYVRLTSTSSHHWSSEKTNTVMCAAELAVFKTEGGDTDTPTSTTYTVTLPTDGEGYTVAASGDSASPVAAGGSYSFTVAIVYGYDSSAMVVKANDTVLTAKDGVYTIENINAAQKVTVTGVKKTTQTDPNDYITVVVENTSGDGSVLLKPTRLKKEDYVNDYVTPALQQAMGSSKYVKYETTWDTSTLYTITGIYDAAQDDSYLNNGDVDGYKWQVLINNEAWSGRDYNKAYKLQGGDVIRCIYTNEAIADVAGQTSKDALIQLAAEVSADVQTTKAYQDAMVTIVSDTATATDVQNAITALQNATVVNATSVEITAGDSVDLEMNKSLTLQAAVLPANATDVPVWSTSNSEVVSVDAASGQITGVSAGTATVTVTCGTATDTITVNVTAVAAESVTITNGDVTVQARFTVQLEATVAPENSTDLVTWSVADESIATVDANGVLTGVTEGETTVTATAGTVTHTVKVTVTATTSSYVYFKYSDGSVQEMVDDSFTLTVLDEGYFVVANTTAAATWSCSEYVSAGGEEMKYNYWINSEGKYQPYGVKQMTATVNAGGFYKTFTINTVSSGISEIKAYIGSEERNAENPYEVTGMVSGIPITVQGKNADGNWVYIPTQAVQIDSSNTNVARIQGNQMNLIHEGDADITVTMLDNSEVSASFNAVCKPVQVTAINVVLPEVFYIDKWDSMGSVFVGLYKGYEDSDSQYYINYTPSNATNQDVIWEDLTPEIAEYDEGWSTGIVPKKAGTAKFKVTSVSNPDVSQEVSINFAYKTPLQSAKSSQETYEMNVGESLDPGLTFTPSNATETKFTWTYSQDGIVEIKDTVSSSGYDRVVSRKIMAWAPGTVTVTGTPVDNTAGCENVVFTVKVNGSSDTQQIDYLQIAKDDIAHGLEYLENQSQASYNDEWTIFTNLRAGGYIDEQTKITYLKSVKAKLDSNEAMQPTDYVRLVLTLPLLGQDPEDFEGYDLIEKLYNGSLSNQTSNQICFTLLALDSRNYEIPETAQWNRDALIEKILTFQATDGGFGLSVGNSGDVDMTGMVLQSLAPYYNSSYPEVQSAVNKALEYLKGQLNENIGYIVGGAENACSAAQVLTALAALKIDPTDSANGFTFGTKNLVTNLHSFKQETGFAYLLGSTTNIMGTQQTTYALEAYRRYAEGENALYDLTDLDGETGTTNTYKVTLPTGDGYTAEAVDENESPVAEGGRFTFTVTILDGYTKDENFAVKANGTSLTEAEGKYTIKNITSDQTITVEGIRAAEENETFTVTLPTGEGYTAEAADDSESPVKYGGSYVFTVELAEGYAKNSGFSVKANGTTLTEKDGKYTVADIKEDQTITITGVVESITVNFSLLGDDKHEDGETAVHTLIDGNLQTWVEATDYEVAKDSTVKDVLEIVLSQNGMTCSNPSGNYVASIVKDDVKIGEFTNGSLSGWMYTLNGVHPGLGVAEQKLKDGDVVVFHYTDDYTYEENKAAANEVIALIDAIGDVDLTKEDEIEAARKAYDELEEAQQKLVENYETLTSAETTLALLKASEEDKAAADKVIDLIEAIGDVTAESKDDIDAARKAYDALTDTQKNLVTNYQDLLDAEEILALLNRVEANIVDIYKTTGDYLAGKTLGFGSVNGEWAALGLVRSGRTVADSYYEAAAAYVKDNINNDGRLNEYKSTENSRLILALTAIGKDVADVNGYDLIAGLNEMSYIRYQGLNGTLFALIALDSHDYTPAGDVTREGLVKEILSAQLNDGGWSVGTSSDVDMTAMAIQALAPYYNADADVKAAVDEALTWLSNAQNNDGSFSSGGVSNAESTAQVIVALTALGIDPDEDSRFIKTGITTVQALAQFYVEGGGFEHIAGSGRNDMATEQGYYALTAYARFKNEQTSLYDMSDVKLDKEAAAEVDALINAIGTVTVDSGPSITAARKAYEDLTDDQKALVTKLADLQSAETTYAQKLENAAENQKFADQVAALIDQIGNVTLSTDSENKINAARSAYNALDASTQRPLVSNISKLTAAEAKLAALKQAAADDDAVANVISLINKIDTDKSTAGQQINKGSLANIQTARNAYDKLRNDTLRANVTNRQDLFDAEKAWNETYADMISVTFTLLGDYVHTTGTAHTLAGNNLQTWIAAKTYEVKPGATVKDLLEMALDLAGMTWSNPTGNYVESITRNGVTLGEFTNGTNSGWMYTLNGKHPSLGVAQQTLVNGDKVVFHYTDDYTKEEGSMSSSGTTSGTASGTTNYITTTTTTQNTETAESVDRLIEDIGEEITLDSEAKIRAARAAYDKLTEEQKKLVENYDVLVAAEAALAELKGASTENIYIETGDYLQGLGTPNVGSIGGEWMVIGLARSDREVPSGYYDNVVHYVRQNINNLEQLHSAKSTDNSRLILALTAIGRDVTNVDGHDLLKGLNDMAYIQKQGINGPIWALLAFDSGNYPVPEGDVSRDKLIEVILDAQLADGGWAMSGENADTDMTAMAIQSLAPYVYSNAEVKSAVLKAVATLSNTQNGNGSFSSVDGPNSESIAQVIVALTALGIDADTDARFVKNGISAMDALVSYYVPGGGFRHILDGDLDGMATEQAYYALVAYNRMLQNRNFLYDMTDVIDMGGDVIVEETTEPTEAPTEPVEEENDGNPMLVWVSVMALCAAAAAALLLGRKKFFKG